MFDRFVDRQISSIVIGRRGQNGQRQPRIVIESGVGDENENTSTLHFIYPQDRDGQPSNEQPENEDADPSDRSTPTFD